MLENKLESSSKTGQQLEHYRNISEINGKGAFVKARARAPPEKIGNPVFYIEKAAETPHPHRHTRSGQRNKDSAPLSLVMFHHPLKINPRFRKPLPFNLMEDAVLDAVAALGARVLHRLRVLTQPMLRTHRMAAGGAPHHPPVHGWKQAHFLSASRAISSTIFLTTWRKSKSSPPSPSRKSSSSTAVATSLTLCS